MKKYFILIFLILLIFIAGCKQKQDTSKGTFIGGIKGLSVELVNLAPPSQFNQNDSVKLKVLVKNKGENKNKIFHRARLFEKE